MLDGVVVDGCMGVDEEWGRRPGKSGTRTVTSVSSTRRLGSGVVVDGVLVVGGVLEVVVEVGVVEAEAATVVVVGTDDELLLLLAFEAVPVELPGRSRGTVSVLEPGIDGGVTVPFCSPIVFQMDGPTELNQGGRGRAVDEVGVAVIKIKRIR